MRLRALIILTALVFATPVSAQNEKISQMPSGGNVQPTDLIPIVRGGNNLSANIKPSQLRSVPSNQWSNVAVFGDINSYNYDNYIGNTGFPYNGYGYLVSKQIGAGVSYYVNKGFGAYDCSVTEQFIVPNSNPQLQGNPLSLWLPTLNDPAYGAGAYQAHETDTNSCRLGGLAWLAVPASYKVNTQSAACVQTGAWANNTHYATQPLANGVTSQTNGSTLACTVTSNGGPFYLAYLMNGNNGGTFTYQIDGGVTTTVATEGQNAFTFPISSSSYTHAAVRIPNSVAGTHTITIAVTSATSPSNTVTPEWIGTPPGKAYASTSPVVVLSGQVPVAAYPAASTAFNNDQKNQANQLLADGLQVLFADINGMGYFNAATDFSTFASAGLAINSTGFQHIADAMNGVIQGSWNSSFAENPLQYGASCNSYYFPSSFSDGGLDNGVSTTQGSPTIAIRNYVFQPGIATQFGGGDVGRRICIGPGSGSSKDVGPCSYIKSVNVAANTADMGVNAAQTASFMYATMGGYPTNPNDPSTAADDTIPIQNAILAAAQSSGKVSLPNNCMVHNLQPAFVSEGSRYPVVTVEGNGPGQFYVYGNQNITAGPMQATILNCGITGYASDTPQCIQTTPHMLWRNFMIRAPVFPSWKTRNISAACLGYSTVSHSGPGNQVLTDHMSYFGCPINVGQAYGYNYDVNFTASFAGNGDGTTTMTVSSIDSTNFKTADNWGLGTDFLSLGRVVTGTSIPSNTAILSVDPTNNDTTGTYTVSGDFTVSSEAVVSPHNTQGMELRDSFSQSSVYGIAYNGDFSDSVIDQSVCTGTFANGCWRIGPQVANYGNGANRWIGGRAEEQQQTAFTVDGGGLILTGADIQFNGGYNIKTLGNNSIVQMTGGYIYGGGHCSGFHNSMIRLGGSSPSISVDGVGLEAGDFGSGCGGTTNYLFASDSGVDFTNSVISLTGGQTRPQSAAVTGLTDWTNGTPAKYMQRTSGWPIIDTTQSTESVSATGNIGIGTTIANTLSTLDMSQSTLGPVIFPPGTTAGRPSPAATAMTWFNTSTSALEYYNGTNWGPLATIPPVPNAIGGLTLVNDAASPNTVFDVLPGSASADDRTITMNLPLTFTKTLGAWVAGTGNGSLDTGAVANNTNYHVFLIENTATPVTDILSSTSAYPVMPTGYSEKRIIGDIKTDGSANIRTFVQIGNRISLGTSTLDMNAVSVGTTASLVTLNVPPDENVQPLAAYSIGTSGAAILWTDPATLDVAVGTSNPFAAAPGFSAIGSSSVGTVNTMLPSLYTNLSSQIRVRASAAATPVSEVTYGWINPFLATSSCLYSPPLDTQAQQPIAAYSFRLLSSAFLGKPIVRLHRSSDNTEKDFAVFYPNCTIQQNDSFFDASTYTLAKFYDQSGRGIAIGTSTVAAQPVVTLSCQNGQPCATFNSSSNFAASTSPNTYGPLTISAVFKTPSSGGSNTVMGMGQGNGFNTNSLRAGSTACLAYSNTCGGGACGSSTSVSCSASSWIAGVATSNASAQTIYANASNNATASPVIITSGLFNLYLGQGYQSSTHYTGSISEAMIFAPDIGSTASNAIQSNQRSFWGF